MILTTCLFAIPVLVCFRWDWKKKKAEITKLGYEKYFLQGHILSTTGAALKLVAALIVVDCVCVCVWVISKQAIMCWYSVHIYLQSQFLFVLGGIGKKQK